MIDSDAVELNFRRYSDAGPPLIILHGLFGSLSNWGWHSKQLASSFSVYGVDLRNHGESPHGAEMNYPVMAEDVAAMLQAENISECAIVGHSMGGKVAMELALTRPELVSRMVVVDIAPVAYESSADGHLDVLQGMQEMDFDQIKTRADAAAFLDAYIKDEGTRQFVLTNLMRGHDGRYRWRLNLDAIESNYARLREKLGPGTPFNKPVLFIKGALSEYIQAQHEAETMALFPGAAVKVILETGHWVHAEKPQAVQKIINDFLLG